MKQLKLRNRRAKIVATLGPACETEKTIEEMSEQLSDSDKETLSAGVKEVREALESDDSDRIESATQALQSSSNDIFSKMYQAAGAAPGADAGAGAGAGSADDEDDDVIDAEFEES